MLADPLKFRIISTFMLCLGLTGFARAATIPKPDGAKSWILVSSGDCDDDGQATVDRAHCAGEVTLLNQPGDIGHGVFGAGYQILASASINANAMFGLLSSGSGSAATFMDMSMVDTYTLQSLTLPAGSQVPVTVSFRGAATMIPMPLPFTTAFGGGFFMVRIGNAFNPSAIVVPENTRVNAFGAASNPSFSLFPSPSSAEVPIDLTATHTFSATVGTPFDLAFAVIMNTKGATIDFTHTATISFTLPEGTFITSTGGFGGATPTQHSTWGRLKTLYR